MRVHLILSACLAVTLSPLASAEEGLCQLYDVDFQPPFHTVDQDVITDASGFPRRGPSALLGEAPKVRDGDSPGFFKMVMRGEAVGARQVRFDLNGLDPLIPGNLQFDRYRIEARIGLPTLNSPTGQNFFVLLDTESDSGEIAFRNNGTVDATSPLLNNSIGTTAELDEDQIFYLSIVVDTQLDLWSAFIGPEEIFRDEPFTADDLQFVRFAVVGANSRVDVHEVEIFGVTEDFVEPDLDPANSVCTGDVILEAPATNTLLYRVDFNAPDHDPGEAPTVSFSNAPRDGVSQWLGDALIASQRGSNTQQALILLGRGESITTSESRVRFFTGYNSEGAFDECFERYILTFDVDIIDIRDSADVLTITGEGGSSTSLIFTNTGEIAARDRQGNQTITEILPGDDWRRGREESWRIEYDIEMANWRVFRGQTLVYDATVAFGHLAWIEFSLLDVEGANSGALIDNIDIFGAKGFVPGPNDLNNDGIVDARDVAYGLQQEIHDVDSLTVLLEEIGYEVGEYNKSRSWNRAMNRLYKREVIRSFIGIRPKSMRRDDIRLLFEVWENAQPGIDDIVDTGGPDADGDGDTDEQDLALVLEKGNIGDTVRTLAILDTLGYNPADSRSEKSWNKRVKKLYNKRIRKLFFDRRSRIDQNFDRAYLGSLY